MHDVETLVALLAVIGIVGALSQKLPVSMPVLLVLTGTVMSFIPYVPAVKLDPEVVFLIFLPPLLYSDAFHTNWRELKVVGDFISLQAIGLVLVTIVGVAAAIHAVMPSLPWAAAFALGAIVSPTDAVAASALAKEVTLPKKLMDIIKGESLVNDATGLVAYQFAVAATITGAFAWREVGQSFVYESVGGILMGLALGVVISRLRIRINDRPIEIVVSLLTPFFAYLIAEHLNMSGVLCVVVTGLFIGWRGPLMSPHARLYASANWDTIAYVLNGLSFLLMGLQVHPIIDTVRIHPPLQLLLWTATAAFTPIAIRFAWTFIVGTLYSALAGKRRPSWQEMFIVSWSGMRGVVSLAAALALPLVCENGSAFPQRELLIFLTIGVIASTLLLQGITLPFIVKRFQLPPTDPERAYQEERRIRLFMCREAIRAVDEFARKREMDLDDPMLKRLLDRYLEEAVAHMNVLDDKIEEKNETWRLLCSEGLSAQRRSLIKIRDQHEIEETMFQLLQKELDLQEAQLNGTGE